MCGKENFCGERGYVIKDVDILRIRVPEFSKTNTVSRIKNILTYLGGYDCELQGGKAGLCTFNFQATDSWRTSWCVWQVDEICKVHL